MEPQDWCDRLVENSWKPVLETIEAANDDFIRTTSHATARCAEVLGTVRDNGHACEADFEGPYCVGCEGFKRPHGDLVDGKLPHLHQPVEMLHESNYFFRLAQFQDALLEHYRRHPNAVEPEERLQRGRLLHQERLKDISMSRSRRRLGHTLAVGRQAGRLRLVRRAAELHHRHRLRRDDGAARRRSGPQRPPGRQDACASMRCTGQPC